MSDPTWKLKKLGTSVAGDGLRKMPDAVLQWECNFSPGCLRIKGKQGL